MSTDAVPAADATPHGAATIPSGPGTPVGYLGKPGLWKLVLKNLLLTVVTLGIYRFWARVSFRRYFWSNITAAGEPLEYTGTGRELFIGFLIVLAVLVPLGVVYAVLQRLALGNPTAAIALQMAYFLGLALLIQTAIFRARRYRLSRTLWRGIRAGQTGSTWRYVGLSFLYGLLSLATLGLAVPWADVGLERYKTNHTWFGDGRFSLKATGWKLFPRWLAVLAFLFLPFVVFFLVNAEGIAKAALHSVTGGKGRTPQLEAMTLLLIPFLVGLPAMIWYRVSSFRYLASSTYLGEISLRSDARARSVLGIVLVFFLGFMGLILLFILPVIMGFFLTSSKVDLSVELLELLSRVFPYAMILVTIAMVLPGYWLLNYCWLRARILRHLATTLTVENMGALEQIAQSSRPRQRFGEGLADSFDIGAF